MKRWIEETFHPHWRVGMEADKILHEEKTEHQHLVIFENAVWGTVLILDGVFQLTTLDEFIYHEMMAHVPLMALERPRRVLVIGGGDGGVLREVLKHPSVEKATLCEIDRSVIDLSLKYYPQVSNGAFDNPRADIVIGDGLKYVAETTEKFDAIIVDSSEPIGPSAVLHTEEFFANCKRALKSGGIVVTQNGLPFLCADAFASTTRILSSLFKCCAPYLCHQPCYFGGEFAINWGSDEPAHLEIPAAKLARRQKARKIETRYWTPDFHVAAFALPAYAQKTVNEAKAAAAGRGGKAKQKSKAAT
ncbi:MAG TPA: polyamine aminopropyltransferase [Hyphomicrobiaceae bacterium]|nr:polyamine aminopropyltransferase [Hyphomicrobiaceae bacterium]